MKIWIKQHARSSASGISELRADAILWMLLMLLLPLLITLFNFTRNDVLWEHLPRCVCVSECCSAKVCLSLVYFFSLLFLRFLSHREVAQPKASDDEKKKKVFKKQIELANRMRTNVNELLRGWIFFSLIHNQIDKDKFFIHYFVAVSVPIQKTATWRKRSF